MEGFKNENSTSERDAESQAEKELERILENPDNAFLETIPMNATKLENAATATEALAFATKQIEERERRTFLFTAAEKVEGVEIDEISYSGLRHTLHTIKETAIEIGVGGDAYVVIAQAESENGVSEVCYKFAKAEETPRGRNTMSQELQIQSLFYAASESIKNGKIGVPEPKYYCEIANNKMIAMEKLRARSIDDLLRGVAKLPTWFTEEFVDIFCDELERTITAFHDNGLYHRDLHFGNIMVTSQPVLEKHDKLGYIIDFGLSGKGVEGLDPYKKVIDERVFTYDDDYGRISTAKKELQSLIQRNV